MKKSHNLPDCMLVWYNPYLKWIDATTNDDQICEQGWADLEWDGINKMEAKKARKYRDIK